MQSGSLRSPPQRRREWAPLRLMGPDFVGPKGRGDTRGRFREGCLDAQDSRLSSGLGIDGLLKANRIRRTLDDPPAALPRRFGGKGQGLGDLGV
jgi:hypothetical protein